MNAKQKVLGRMEFNNITDPVKQIESGQIVLMTTQDKPKKRFFLKSGFTQEDFDNFLSKIDFDYNRDDNQYVYGQLVLNKGGWIPC